MGTQIPYEDVDKAINTFIGSLNESYRAGVRETATNNILATINAANKCDLLGVITAGVDRCEVMRDLHRYIKASKPDEAERDSLIEESWGIYSNLDNHIVKVLQGHCECKEMDGKAKVVKEAVKPALKATGTELAAQQQALDRMETKAPAKEPAKPIKGTAKKKVK
jgi:hypothetical protein